MNKLTDNQKRLVVLGVGLFMVLLGVVQAIFKPPFLINNRKIVDEGTFILMMVAAMLLFSIKRKRKPETDDPNKTVETIVPEEVKAEQLEEKK